MTGGAGIDTIRLDRCDGGRRRWSAPSRITGRRDLRGRRARRARLGERRRVRPLDLRHGDRRRLDPGPRRRRHPDRRGGLPTPCSAATAPTGWKAAPGSTALTGGAGDRHLRHSRGSRPTRPRCATSPPGTAVQFANTAGSRHLTRRRRAERRDGQLRRRHGVLRGRRRRGPAVRAAAGRASRCRHTPGTTR